MSNGLSTQHIHLSARKQEVPFANFAFSLSLPFPSTVSAFFQFEPSPHLRAFKHTPPTLVIYTSVYANSLARAQYRSALRWLSPYTLSCAIPSSTLSRPFAPRIPYRKSPSARTCDTCLRLLRWAAKCART